MTHEWFHGDDAAAKLEREAELAAGVTAEAIALCVTHAGSKVRRVADLGCGPGVAATALAEAFPAATVVAADGSPVMLQRTAERAERLGLSDRVETATVDLNGDLHSLGTFDLVWAALALHHARDEQASLESFAALVRPKGLICLLEKAGATDYAGMLEAAGLSLVEQQTLTDPSRVVFLARE